MCLLLRLYKSFQGEEASVDDLIELVQQIVAFHMKVWLIEKLLSTSAVQL